MYLMKCTCDMGKLVLKRHHISKLSCDFVTCKYVALVKFNIFKC